MTVHKHTTIRIYIRYTVQCTKTSQILANCFAMVSHQWRLALASYYLPQPGNSASWRMASWQSIWILDHKELNFFIFIMVCFLQLATQRNNNSWLAPWFTKYTKASEQLEHATVDIHMYMHFILHNTVAKSCRKYTAATIQLPVHY